MNAGPLNVLELFAGIGGLSLGLQRAGLRIVGHVEINPFCRAVLHKHWPEVPCHDDVRTAAAWWRSTDRPRVDVVAGGYPCQPESTAGKRRGTDDDRWLWPDMARVIHAIRPRYVVGENVMGHRTRGLRFVLRDLQRLGYTASAGIIRACEMGAPHPRPRLLVLAHTDRPGRHPGSGLEPPRTATTRTGRWADEPRLARMAHGLPGAVDRRRALGNAVVPHVAEFVGRIILNHHTGR
ncbi:DNA cytosine methyltransferase [Salinispora tropica]|uniref:DNA (cytosine-5-)-methyltransferase n=1 Tax=Salinispora tropica (strain ATCC BAA-916 / DSM 44818 / JCM 13857 / NBRC 105044 / CNB-440) TaxID=369723 RepID=A4X0Z6_SALTO|nr:DNA cytosine methyltransferase [Salinispora tropica]ABP52546.1 C-5 cytosine-specific DNA methylase [Salinispora tropica CNB-440]